MKKSPNNMFEDTSHYTCQFQNLRKTNKDVNDGQRRETFQPCLMSIKLFWSRSAKRNSYKPFKAFYLMTTGIVLGILTFVFG